MQWDEYQKHCVEQNSMYKEHMLYNSIYFKLKKRQKRKPACIVSKVRIEFTSVLGNINWKEARGILPGYWKYSIY